MKRFLLVSGLAASLTSAASAADVYLLSSLDSATDTAAAAALTSRGHTVTIGVDFTSFDGSVNLAGFETVYLQCNNNWTALAMPAAGQQQLIDWVNAGGRLVTSEWVTYYSYATGKFALLDPILPGVQDFSYGTFLTTTYTAETPDAAINAGVPSPLTFSLTSYTGTEGFTIAKPGATTYYTSSSDPGAAGLLGWTVGSGSVYSFFSTCGPDQVGDTNFGRLFSNVMGATSGGGCYANCDGVGGLTANDFVCFVSAFNNGASYANCDGVGGLTANDFVCFLTQYNNGCP
jgi:hypothetical protein